MAVQLSVFISVYNCYLLNKEDHLSLYRDLSFVESLLPSYFEMISAMLLHTDEGMRNGDIDNHVFRRPRPSALNPCVSQQYFGRKE